MKSVYLIAALIVVSVSTSALAQPQAEPTQAGKPGGDGTGPRK